MLNTTDEVRSFLAEATFPQPCFVEQMELKVVIRSLTCRFAVLVTSGLKIIPRCSECMAYSTPQDYMNEDHSHFDTYVKVEPHAKDDDGCGKTTDEEQCSNTDDSEDEGRGDVFNETRMNSTESSPIKIEPDRDKMTQHTSSKWESKDSAESDKISDDQGNLSVRSDYCSVPISTENPMKSLSSSLYKPTNSDKSFPGGHPTSSSNSVNGSNISLRENLDVEEVSNKLPTGVTVTRVPKGSVKDSPNKLLNRKNRDVIVTASGVVLEHVPRGITHIPITNDFGFQHKLRSMKSRSKRCEFGRRVGRKPKPKGLPILPRMPKKSISYVKISETCKICLHHFTVKQAYDRDQKVNIPIICVINRSNIICTSASTPVVGTTP